METDLSKILTHVTDEALAVTINEQAAQLLLEVSGEIDTFDLTGAGGVEPAINVNAFKMAYSAPYFNTAYEFDFRMYARNNLTQAYILVGKITTPLVCSSYSQDPASIVFRPNGYGNLYGASARPFTWIYKGINELITSEYFDTVMDIELIIALAVTRINTGKRANAINPRCYFLLEDTDNTDSTMLNFIYIANNQTMFEDDGKLFKPMKMVDAYHYPWATAPEKCNWSRLILRPLDMTPFTTEISNSTTFEA